MRRMMAFLRTASARRTLALLVGVLGLAIAAAAIAQGVVETPVVETTLPPFTLQALVQAAFAALLPFAVDAIRKLKPKMPRILVWAIAPALSTAVQYLLSLASVPGMAGWKGFLAGLAAIALHEFATTLDQHGVE